MRAPADARACPNSRRLLVSLARKRRMSFWLIEERRRRFMRAQKCAGVEVRRFHDLRHTFGTHAVRQLDLVSVQRMMGHARLTTTERYLHSKPRPSDAAILTAVFADQAGDISMALSA
jgi:integrase